LITLALYVRLVDLALLAGFFAAPFFFVALAMIAVLPF
jgi:hypothetical protein